MIVMNYFVKFYLFFLFLLAFFFIFLLVDGGLLPLGVNLGSLSSFPHVELWSLLLSLLGFPFIKGQSLGFVAHWLLFLNLFFIFSGFSILGGFFNRGIVWFITFSLDIVLKVAPISLSASAALFLGLDASSRVSALAVEFPFASATSGSGGSSSSSSGP